MKIIEGIKVDNAISLMCSAAKMVNKKLRMMVIKATIIVRTTAITIKKQ